MEETIDHGIARTYTEKILFLNYRALTVRHIITTNPRVTCVKGLLTAPLLQVLADESQ